MKRIAVCASGFLLCLSLLGSGSGAFADGEPKAFEKQETPEAPEPSNEPIEKKRAKEKPESKWNTFPAAFLGTVLGAAGKGIYDVVLRDHGFRYAAYPYSRENYAYYDPQTEIRGAPGFLKLEYQRMNPDLYALTWRMMLRMGSGFDVSVVDTLYDEKTRFDDHERMKFSRFSLSYLRSPASGNILMRSGIGYVCIDDWAGPEFGFEVDIFPQEPFAIHLGFAQIFPVNHSSVTEYDFSVGLVTGAFELAVGYRGILSKRRDIDGAYVSIGFWF
jgi:hypothetical protein